MGKTNRVGSICCEGKNDYKSGGVFNRSFLATKIKYCVTVDKFGIIQQHKTFRGFNDSIRLTGSSQYYETIEVEKKSAMSPKSYKKLFNSGVIIAAKMRFCNKCSKENCCGRFNNQINENTEFEAF